MRYSHSRSIPAVYLIQQLPWFISSYLPDIGWLKRGLERLLWLYGGWLMRQFSAAITPTKTIAEIVNAQTGIPPYVISNGVDLNVFKPDIAGSAHAELRKKLGVPPHVPMILHVGRLDVDKQVETVIQAGALALSQTNAHLLIVGDGQEKAILMQLCEKLGIQSRSHFTGFVSVAEGLPDIYRLANVFVTTSEIETQGIVLLEAAASGIPIVALRATCISEIVIHGVNGYLAHPGGLEELAAHLTRLIQDSSSAFRMGQAGRKVALAHSSEYALDRHESLLLKYHALGEGWHQRKVTTREAETESP
jgi:glycosyltransferase involved in cell wall biosynthesis